MRRTANSGLELDVELRLAEAERGLVGTPHEILGLSLEASNSEACAAFIALSHEFHPNQFGSKKTELIHRAALVYSRLKSSLDSVVSVPAVDRRPTRRMPGR